MARPPRLERGTPGLEGRCSIQLSYGRVTKISDVMVTRPAVLFMESTLKF